MDRKYGIKSDLRAIRKKCKAVNGKEKVKLLGKLMLRPFGFQRCLFLSGYYEEEYRQQEKEDKELYEELRQVTVESRSDLPGFKAEADDFKKEICLEVPAEKLRKRNRYIALACENLDKGGLEEVVCMLAMGLKQQDIAVRIFCMQSGGSIAERLAEQNVEVLVFHGDKSRVKEFCLKEPPMLVNTHYVGEMMEVFYELQIPIIEVIHNTYAFLDETGWNRERKKSQYIHKYIAVSKSAERMFRAKCPGIGEDKITVIGNGTESVHEMGISREKTRSALGISSEAFVCIAVGSIDARKNQVGLLRAWSIFKNLVEEEAVLLVVGSSIDVEYEAHVEEVLNQRALHDSVIMLGQSDCVHELLNASDLFLMDSYYEGWSVAATEALCYGVPVIHSDCGSGRQLTAEGRMGRLCPNPLNNLENYDNIELFERMQAGINDNLREMVTLMRQMHAERAYWKGVRKDMMKCAKEKFSFDTMFARYLYEFEKIVKENEVLR